MALWKKNYLLFQKALDILVMAYIIKDFTQDL